MAKKKKKSVRGQRHKVSTLAALSADELLAQGHLFLDQEKYQDAILCFKQLLKQGQNQEILRGLAQAYIGRIQSLAEKSMIKEAMVMLETLVRLCPNAQTEPLQLSLLIQAGSFIDAVKVYKQCYGQLETERINRLEVLFGALLVARVPGLRPEYFADDSLVARHYPAALTAIDMFFAGQEGATQNALKQIPFRSPYRDLRTLLKGLLQFPQDKNKGEVILRKIEKDSPYFQFAAKYLAASENPEIFLKNLAATPKRDHQKIRDQHGLSSLQLRIVEELSHTDGQPLSLYHIVRRHGSGFTLRQRIELLKNILPFCKDQVVNVLTHCAEFDMREKCRIGALAAEKDGAFEYAIEFWDDYLNEIDWKDPARYKEIAMVLRRQVKLMQREEFYFYDPEDILNSMLKSLEYDSSHVRTWLDAAEFARRDLTSKQHYAILNDAVLKLPENVTILLAAMKACGTRGAHKKASSLANRVLEIDPINTSALDFLVESRLEHGRKLARQQKWVLAEKELQSADTRVKALRFRGRNRICLGMLQLLQDNEEGLQLISLGRKENGSPLLSHVLTSLESRLYRLPPARQKEFDRELRLVAEEAAVVDPTEFLRLISWLSSFDGDQWLQLNKSCQVLKKYFSRAAVMDWSREEGLLLCRAFDRVEMAMALTKCSAKLLKKFPADPEVKAWHLVATYSKGNKIFTTKIIDTVEDLQDELAKKHCFELCDRLEGILMKGRSERYLEFFNMDDDEDEFFDDGPFKIPKKAKSEEAPKPKVEPVRGRQLNLFDDKK